MIPYRLSTFFLPCAHACLAQSEVMEFPSHHPFQIGVLLSLGRTTWISLRGRPQGFSNTTVTEIVYFLFLFKGNHEQTLP